MGRGNCCTFGKHEGLFYVDKDFLDVYSRYIDEDDAWDSRLKGELDFTELTDPAWVNQVIMEGRDIGTVIMPNATLKVFLTAKAEVRARRRWKEQCLHGVTDSYEKTLSLLKQRDREDSTRAIAPLKQADDAVLVDCTEMTIEETTDKILAFWNAKKPDWRRFE